MIAAILDAGPTGSGLESTIIDLSLEKPEILRQGGLPVEELEALLGCGLKAWSSAKPAYETGDMEIILGEDGLWMSLIAQADPGETAIVHYREIPLMGMVDSIKTYTLDLEGQGQGLFTIIREAEAKGYKKLVFAPLPSALSGVGRALAERIRRAAGRQ
jgi:L-threonylcarbamoyladenylate synthase